MSNRQAPDDAFDQLLRGEDAPVSRDLERLTKIAKALQPAARPTPAPQFRARLRNELLAQASAASREDEELFAAFLDGRIKTVPEEIKPLVAVASALEPAVRRLPEPSFRYQLRNHLIREAARPESLGARVADRLAAVNARMRRSLRLVGATGLAALMMLGSGAALAASQNAIPGETLYGVKLMREDAQRSVTSGKHEGVIVLGFARTRLSEVRTLADRDVRDQKLYVSTLDRMDALTLEGQSILADVYERDGDRDALERVVAFADAQAVDLTTLVDRVPVAARPALSDSLTLVERVSTQAKKDLCGCPGADDPIVTGDPVATPDDPRTPTCACEPVDRDGDSTGSSGGSDGDNDSGDGDGDGGSKPGPGDDDPTPPKDTDEPTVDLPNVGDTDEVVEDLIDDLVDTLPTPVPTVPLPSLAPSASVPSP